MTFSDTPRPAALDPSARPVLRVRDQGELIGTLPALIGFHPRESLVLMATGGPSGRRLGLTVRIDLPAPEHAATVSDAAVRGLLLDRPAGAAVVVVSERGGTDPPEPPPPDPPWSEVVDHVVHSLEGHGIDVHTVLRAAGTAAGARWWCYDPCGCTGVVPDASATPLAAAAVVNGQVVHADRAELERVVAPVDAATIRTREALLIRAVDEALAGAGPGSGPDSPGKLGAAFGGAAVAGEALDGTALVDRAIADSAAGRLVLDDARVVALAGALLVPGVRDAALERCCGSDAGAAEHLWTALVRETPDPEAAEPAVLLAVSALLRGDGALANVALDRAERAWPGHRLTGIMRAVADAGVRPQQARALLEDAVGAGWGVAAAGRAAGWRGDAGSGRDPWWGRDAGSTRRWPARRRGRPG